MHSAVLGNIPSSETFRQLIARNKSPTPHRPLSAESKFSRSNSRALLLNLAKRRRRSSSSSGAKLSSNLPIRIYNRESSRPFAQSFGRLDTRARAFRRRNKAPIRRITVAAYQTSRALNAVAPGSRNKSRGHRRQNKGPSSWSARPYLCVTRRQTAVLFSYNYPSVYSDVRHSPPRAYSVYRANGS